MFFIGCDNTDEQTKTCNPACEDYKTCSKEGKCVLQKDRCETNNDCKDNKVCDETNHKCVEKVCEKNQKRCSEDKKNLEICNNNKWKVSLYCSNNNKVCDEDTLKCKSLDPICTKGETKCNGKNLEICSEDKTKWEVKAKCSECKEATKECTISIPTFKNTKVAFGNNFKQSAEGAFTFPEDQENIKSIKAYIVDTCSNKNCDEWDRYANLYVKDKETNDWYEIGRFITPYWVGTEKLPKGFEIDVTDFKSLISGKTDLKIYTETWNNKGRTYFVNFEIVYGTPDYKYYSVAPVIQYNKSSIDGVPYGKPHDKVLVKSVELPKNTQKAHLRTIITGWGHAQPATESGPCAEWCNRKHHILINTKKAFEHYLGPLGCANNPINNQAPGNWMPNRAGWCPGMVVPNRIDELDSSLFNAPFKYKYKFQEWKDDGTNKEGAFYAISTFVIAKSNEKIEKPVVK